jgi:hypothetical protein
MATECEVLKAFWKEDCYFRGRGCCRDLKRPGEKRLGIVIWRECQAFCRRKFPTWEMEYGVQFRVPNNRSNKEEGLSSRMLGK